MRIRLDDIYTLNSDAYCTWITQKVEKQDGTGSYERAFNGYQPNLQECLLSFVRTSVNVSQANTLEKLAEDIDHITSCIKEFCEVLKGEQK